MSTGIPYCDETINPIRTADGGYHCTKTSPGCTHCFGEGFNNRFGNHKPYDNSPTEFVIKWTALAKLLHWKKPKRIFVQDMSDLFLDEISVNKKLKVLEITQVFPQHTFLFLTKRPVAAKIIIEYYLKYRLRKKNMPPNFWLGVSVENQQTADERIPILLQIPAAVHWVSVEPMFGPITLNYIHSGGVVEIDALNGTHGVHRPHRGTNDKIDWVVCGGETGHRARPMHPDWVRRVRDDCVAAGVPFWFKSWGEWAGYETYDDMDHIQAINISYIDKKGKTYEKYHEIMGIKGVAYIARVGKKLSGNRLDGRTWEQLP